MNNSVLLDHPPENTATSMLLLNLSLCIAYAFFGFVGAISLSLVDLKFSTPPFRNWNLRHQIIIY